MNVVTRQQRPEVVACPVWLVTTTCFAMGKRWFAGTKYIFNHEPPREFKKHAVETGKRRVRMIPTDELQFEIVGTVGRDTGEGREPRPSEYENEYTGEIPED